MSGRDLIVAGPAMLAGAVALFAPHRVMAWKARAHARRRVDRWQRGRDAWFEEARGLAAYPPPTRAGRVRLAGAGILALGLVLTVLSLHR